MKNMKRLIWGTLGCLTLMLAIAGCSLKPIDKEEAETMIQDYLLKKYGDRPELTEIHWIRTKLQKNIKSQGYYAKTADGYYVRMNVFRKNLVTLVDTRDYPAIESDLAEYFADNPVSDTYRIRLTSVPEGMDVTPEDVWNSPLRGAFKGKYNGNPVEFINDYKNRPGIEFTMEGSESATPLYFIVRAKNRWDFDSERLKEYLSHTAKELGADITSLVVSPAVDKKEMEYISSCKINKQDLIFQSNHVILTGIKAYGQLDLPVSQEPLQPMVRQEASVEGFEISLANTSGEIQRCTRRELALTTEEADGRRLTYNSGGDEAAYRVAGNIYSLFDNELDYNRSIILDLDASVLAPGEPEEGLVLLSLDDNGNIESIIDCFSLADEEWPFRSAAYHNGPLYTYTVPYKQKHFCFASACE